MAKFDVAQICKKGHVINSRSISEPEYNKSYCPTCGKTTITKCPFCKVDIKGEAIHEGPKVVGSYFVAPKICENCGKPFPWSKDYSVWFAILLIILLSEVIYLIIAYNSLLIQLIAVITIVATILLSRKHVFNKFFNKLVYIIGFLGSLASLFQLFGINIK